MRGFQLELVWWYFTVSMDTHTLAPSVPAAEVSGLAWQSVVLASSDH